MKKYLKYIIPVVCIIVIVIIFNIVYDNSQKDNAENYEQNEIENTLINEEENIVEVENIVEDDTINTEVEENVIVQEDIVEENDNATTDKKQAAIDLVKEKWGEDDSVSFRCDSITSSGEYIIAVVSKNSATVKNYFKVNLSEKTVEVDY